MRIWDLPPGYLSRPSLLGEHRELHGLRSILIHGKKGYARHPETLRWVGCLPALAMRHALLAAEMCLRGYVDRTPVKTEPDARWPVTLVTPVIDQIALLKSKYRGKDGGRIPLPRGAQELWAHHKYSMLARDPAEYRRIGRRVAALPGRDGLTALAEQLAVALRQPPSPARLVNALEHMWGHVREHATDAEHRSASQDRTCLMSAIQSAALRSADPYLMSSTALSELAAF